MEHDNIVFREAEKDDNPFLASIIGEAFIEHDAPKHGTVYSDPATDDLYELFRAPGSILWVALIGKSVAGSCGIYPTQGLEDGCAELVKFYLADTARGKGIGKKLLNKCIESANDLGYKYLYLESLPQFSKAVHIYEQNGFCRLNKPMGISGHTACNIWMQKKL